MKLLGYVTRKEVVEFYIHTDATKKSKPLPSSWPDSEDVDALDRWLERSEYKSGVITGFRSWAHVCLSVDDLLDLAVVSGIFMFSRVLRKLVGTLEFDKWEPNRKPFPVWYTPLSQGYFDDDFTIILRAVTPGEKREGAKLYIEDGSGRSICYTRAIHARRQPSKMKAFIGFNPDPSSTFLKGHLEQAFIGRTAQNYSTFDRLIRATGAILEN